ncbi:MAG: hypothetical protein JNL21_32190 [Myxococcales bacterium]|nr:hypothetical protein [Myxococcales bacterium]
MTAEAVIRYDLSLEDLPPELRNKIVHGSLTNAELARHWGVSLATLRRWRSSTFQTYLKKRGLPPQPTTRVAVLARRYPWITRLENEHQARLTTALTVMDLAFDAARILGNKKLCDEVIGDAIEDIARRAKEDRPRWTIYAKVVMTWLWLLFFIARELLAAFWGKSKAG